MIVLKTKDINRLAHKTRPESWVREGSPEREKESMVGRVCGTDRFKPTAKE